MKLGLLTKMSLYILIPSMLGLALVAGISHYMSEDALRKQARQDIAAILKGQEVGLNAVFVSMKEALAQIAENRRLRLFLKLMPMALPLTTTTSFFSTPMTPSRTLPM